MITYVDTSTLLRLVIDEPGSERAEAIWDASQVVASSVLVVVEACAALAAAHRQGRLDSHQLGAARRGVTDLVDQLHLVEVTPTLVTDAAELAEQEALRGYDAVHLAAGLAVGAELFSTADVELAEAARRRSFHVANPLND